jgi:hypothetical protein
MSSFVPFSITHVPCLKAIVSTTQRYAVDRLMGMKVLVSGRASKKRYVKSLYTISYLFFGTALCRSNITIEGSLLGMPR